MHLQRKLEILADAAKYDASCASGGVARKRAASKGGMGSVEGPGICHSYTPDGRCVSLLKILLTNYCVYDCAYCINRRSSNVARARFAIEEVVQLTLDFYRRNYIEGLFLSSGIIQNADYTMEQLVAVAKSLRVEHKFAGYIHLKTIPEASQDLIDQAARYADRVSINVELPSQHDLDRLAPEKQLVQIGTAMKHMSGRIAEARSDARLRYAPGGQSTQLIVGATAASDRELLARASSLYDEHRLRRVYYSAFSPIPDASSALPPAAPPLVREHRLYQADWLLRFYGYDVAELTTPLEPQLSLDHDPKVTWALRNRERFPVDINRADREMLLRVPGLGVRTIDRVLRMRVHRTVRLDDLQRLRVPLRRVLPFITVPGSSGSRLIDTSALSDHLRAPAQQIDLFAAVAARTGEL
jgi:putative DNA modification/repair radical SAM protein